MSSASPGQTPSTEQRAEERAARRAVLAPIRVQLAVANLIVFASSVCAVLPFILIVEASRHLLAGDMESVWPPMIWALVTYAARSLLYSGALLWTHSVDADNQLLMRQLLSDKLRRVPLGWFGARRSADVKKLLADDVEAIHYLVAHAQVEFVAAVTTPVLTLGYLFLVDWRLALVLLAPLLGYSIALAAMMGRDYTARMHAYQELEKQTEATTIEFVDGIQVVRTFGQAGRAHTRFQQAVDEFAEHFRNWVTPMTRIEASAAVLLNPVFMMAVVLVAGLTFVGSGSMDPVDVLPFLLLGLGLGSTVLTVGYAMQSRRQAAAATVRVYRLLQTPEMEQRPVGSADDEDGDGTSEGEAGDGTSEGLVRFADVRFSYRQGAEVLKGIDLELRPGTITAVVGPSGSGKSTLATLLPRFADVDSGRITIDGQDIRELPPAELYRRVGFVFQDVRLLRDTVRANLAIAKSEADDAEIEQAARAAQIHDRILELPRGYETVVGVDAHLSGGEAQRISIARALLANAPILVLDEATAFADPESEGRIQDALATLVADRTVLVIAHRLHTIVGVDEIIVLDAGEIVERGTHQQLLARSGAYAGLWDANEAALGTLAGTTGDPR